MSNSINIFWCTEYFAIIFIFTEGIKQSETLATGVASIIINNKLNTNEIVVVPGANMSVLENDISSSMDLFVKTKRVLICQFEVCLF